MRYRSVLLALAPLTIARLTLTILWGLLVVLLLFPVLPQAARNGVVRLWSRALLWVLGVRVVVRGQGPDRRLARTGLSADGLGMMLLANHVSWLDVHALTAVVPARLVAKAEISRWPVLGLLARASGTLFVERGRRHAVHAVNQKIAEHLRRGETIGVYPEGTTTDGSRLLPFHANLLQPALDAGAQVRPVALRYTQGGVRSEAAAYTGGIHLLRSLWRIMMAPRLTVEVHWLPALSMEAKRRHELAHQARLAVAEALHIRLEATPSVLQRNASSTEGPGSGNTCLAAGCELGPYGTMKEDAHGS